MMHPCPTCTQPINPQRTCPSPVCSDPARNFDKLYATQSPLTHQGEKAIRHLKDGATEWAAILAYGINQTLNATPEITENNTILIANPTASGTHLVAGLDHLAGHTEATLAYLALHTPDITIEPALLAKSHPTRRSGVHGATFDHKQTAAVEHVAAITVTQPQLITGQNVLVYDDVATTCSTLDQLAALLLDHGANQVQALVFGRSHYKPTKDNQ